jgi:Ion channel
MLRQLLVGGAVSVCNIAVHAMAMMLVVGVAQVANSRYVESPRLRLAGVMVATVMMLMTVHVLEVAIWALAYAIFDVAPAGIDLIYFAFVNYTTLGYGDVVPVPAWQILGPITAMNGVLLFGWSTAVIFDVLRRVMAR